MRFRFLIALSGVLSLFVGSPDASAQGHGHAYGHAHQGGVTAGSGSSTPLPASGIGIRDFGVWLDDASVVDPGAGWVSLSMNYIKTDLLRELDFPTADAGVGVARTVQFGFSVPYYNVRNDAGPIANGLGDLYLHSKVQLRDAARSSNHVGYALIPIVEVLSNEAPPGRHRVNWALPVSIELQGNGWRTYGSSGYFSRGSIFASGAIEKTLSDRVWVTGTLSRSVSLHEPPPGLSRARTDIGGGASYQVKPGLIVFGSIGHTLSADDPERSKISLASGISFNLAAPPAPAGQNKHR